MAAISVKKAATQFFVTICRFFLLHHFRDTFPLNYNQEATQNFLEDLTELKEVDIKMAEN